MQQVQHWWFFRDGDKKFSFDGTSSQAHVQGQNGQDNGPIVATSA